MKFKDTFKEVMAYCLFLSLSLSLSLSLPLSPENIYLYPPAFPGLIIDISRQVVSSCRSVVINLEFLNKRTSYEILDQEKYATAMLTLFRPVIKKRELRNPTFKFSS